MTAKTYLKTTGAIILLLVLVVTSAAVQADIIYVDVDATGNGDGTSWTDAYNYLQDALIDDAGSGDEIWVAEGTYYPDEGDTPTNDDRTETFLLIGGVGLYGGFDGTETSRGQRDYVNNVTILSGDIGTADVNTDNSYHVVTGCADVNATMVLDGFTITKGYADGSGADEHGGGINANNLTCPTISNCTITDNYANGIGGGIIAWNVPDRTISNCTINQNYALSGAGIAIAYCDANITNCTISDNEAIGFGGGIRFSVCDPDIRDCIITDNKSTGFGGGGLGVSNSGLIFTPGIPKVSNCVFAGNDANDSYRGALYAYRSELIIENCLFYNNDTSAVCNSIASPNITNCTIVANEGGIENLLTIFPPDMPWVSSPKITNCILWNNTNEVTNESGCNPNISYSDVENCYDSNGVWDPNLGTDGGGNIDEDPCFVNAGANDFHLDPNSPCIDVGDPNGDYSGQTDIDGQPRLADGDGDDTFVVDMGADEYMLVYNDNSGLGYINIQDAIDDANDGDTITVTEGTYYENIYFTGKAITIRSKDPNSWSIVEATVIDGNNLGPVVTFDDGEDANSVLTGFTIAYGNAFEYGGGICVDEASPTILNCIIRDNYSEFYGGGMYNYGNSTISNCIFRDNESCEDGGGMYIDTGAVTVTNSMFINNDSGYNGGAINNSGTGGYATIINCTFSGNTATDEGGAIYGDSYMTLTNCILWGDTASGQPNEIYAYPSSPTVTYSDVEGGWSGPYNIDSDPCFVNPDANDFHLGADSPCINTGDPNRDYTGQTDIDGQPRVIGSRVDIGADETPYRVHNITQNKWYTTIQSAIDDANDGDEIVAYPGTYNETVDFNGVACTVRSTDPNDWGVVADTIIYYNDPNAYVVTFENSEEANSVLTGFTIRKGGVGVYCDWADPNIRNCIIEENTFGAYGHWSGMTIENCLIRDNDLFGIYAFGSPTIRYNKISGHYYDGIYLNSSSSSIKSNWIYDNGRYGVMIIPLSSAVIRNNTIVGNPTAGIYKHSGAQPSISNCILWDNGDDLYACTATYSCIEDCNDVGDPNTTHSICDDPLFVDYANDNFHLDPNSPCIDVGDPDPNDGYVGEFDIDGDNRVIDIPGKGDGDVDVDMGGDEYDDPSP